MKDTHLRSVMKGISWRVTGTVDTIVISYIITGEVKKALAIGGVEVITKIFLYYVHERIWGRVTWGRQKEEEPKPAGEKLTNPI